MDPTRELEQLVDRLAELLDRVRERVGSRSVFYLPAQRLERQQQGHQMLLRAVVQISLESLARLVAGGDDSRPRPPKLLRLPRALADVGCANEEERSPFDLR